MKTHRIVLGIWAGIGVLTGVTGPVVAASPDNPFGIHMNLLRVGVTSVYDDNIDHETIPVESYGWVAGLDARFRTHRRAPFVSFRYAGGYQSFTNSDRWDRWQNAASLGTRIPLVGPLRFDGVVGYGNRVSTEDRDLVNQWTFRPELRADSGPWTLSLEGGYRSRRYTSNAAYDEDIRMITAELAHDRGRNDVKVAYRHEDANSMTGSRSYTRDRARVRNELRIARDHALLLSAEHQWRDYPGELLTVVGEEQPRQDRRWVLQTEWVYDFTRRQDLALQYEFEKRTSNDPEEAYTAHRLELRIRWRLVR